MRYLLCLVLRHNGPVYCAECGAPNEPGGSICVGCGKMLNP